MTKRRAEALRAWGDFARKSRRENGEQLIHFPVAPAEHRCTATSGSGEFEYRCIGTAGHSGGHHFQRI